MTSLTKPEKKPLPMDSESGFYAMMNLAKTLVQTGFLPKAVTTPGQALAIILTGRELGLGPMQSLRSISVINGKPVLAADLQLGIFHRQGGVSRWVKLTEETAVLWLKHPNKETEHTETFSMEDAQKAGLLERGDNYRKYPKAMLRSRAITAGLKSVGWEPGAGMYDPEELDADISPPTAAELAEVPVQLREKEPMPWDGKDEKPAERPAHVTPNGEIKRASLAKWPLPRKDGKQDVYLADMTQDELLTGKHWAKKKDPLKYQELIGQIDEELDRRRT